MVKIFIPGPTEVRADVLQALTHPQIGHRTEDMRRLVRSIKPNLKKLFGTTGDVFLSTSSATGVMEGSLRNLVKKKVLALDCGAWSQKMGDIAVDNGIPCDRQVVPWGKPSDVADLEKKLATGAYDVVTAVWCETSTGVLNPIEEIAKVVRKFDGVLLVVDAVSTLAGVECEVDRLGIDVCLAGSQKCLAMPPGLAVFTVSERAMKRAESVKNRGHYIDFVTFKKNGDKDETPATPTTPHFFALDFQLKRIHAEGMDKRAARHRQMAELSRAWATEKLGLFADPNHFSPTVTCVAVPQSFDQKAFHARVLERGFFLGDGYGKIKDISFRIGHMGDHSVDDLKQLLAAMSAAL